MFCNGKGEGGEWNCCTLPHLKSEIWNYESPWSVQLKNKQSRKIFQKGHLNNFHHLSSFLKIYSGRKVQSFIISRSWKNARDCFHLCEIWRVSFEEYSETTVCVCADTSNRQILKLRMLLLTLPSFKKTPSLF